jgi:hypothetical protein
MTEMACTILRKESKKRKKQRCRLVCIIIIMAHDGSLSLYQDTSLCFWSLMLMLYGNLATYCIPRTLEPLPFTKSQWLHCFVLVHWHHDDKAKKKKTFHKMRQRQRSSFGQFR